MNGIIEDPYHPDNNIGIYIRRTIKIHGTYIGHIITGTIMWFFIYSCYYYWKDFTLTWYRHKENPDLGYIEVLHRYKKTFKIMIGVSLVSLAMFFALKFHKFSDEIITNGVYAFFSLYVLIHLYSYVIRKDEFDFFEDLKYAVKIVKGRFKKTQKLE